MDILAIILISLIMGICLGNDKARNKLWTEIKHLFSKDKSVDCPLKKPIVTYIPPKSEKIKQETKSEPREQPKSSITCPECGNPIEVIDKMPGFFFCDNCKKVVNPNKKETAK